MTPLQSALLLTSVVLTAGQLFGRFPFGAGGSCSDKGRPVASGQVIEAAGCRQLSCRDGVLTTRFCEEVPFGCSFAGQDTSQLFPGCCPFWSCGGGGAGTGGGDFVGSSSGSCNQGSRPVANGGTVFGPGCVKYVCNNGVLTTHFCSPVPAGCTGRQASGGDFPACCTSWSCAG